MKKFIGVPVVILLLVGCQSSYLTPKGERLLQNTKKLCTMYNDLMEIKKEGWEKMLEGKRKAEERRVNKEKHG